MFKSFKASNFRCFKSLDISDLKRINLIAGKNNSGKTALLEAMFIYSARYNPELTLRVNAFRGLEITEIKFGTFEETPWDSLFNEFDISRKIQLGGEYTDSSSRIVHLRVIQDAKELSKIAQYISAPTGKTDVSTIMAGPAQVMELRCDEDGKSSEYYMIFDAQGIKIRPIPPTPPYASIFIHCKIAARTERLEMGDRFGRLQIDKKDDVLLKALQVIDPRLKRITLVMKAGEPIMYGDIGRKRLVALPLMGEGMVRLATLILAIADAKDGIVFFDEIENGLHHSVLTKVWHAIGEAARAFNTQVFATTHSFENIIAAHETFSKEESYDFRLIRLERMDDTTRAISYDQDTLATAIKEGFEVR